MVSGFFGLSKVEIHLCGSVNAKKIIVVVTVVRLVAGWSER